jgi:hypothetical protein
MSQEVGELAEYAVELKLAAIADPDLLILKQAGGVLETGPNSALRLNAFRLGLSLATILQLIQQSR